MELGLDNQLCHLVGHCLHLSRITEVGRLHNGDNGSGCWMEAWLFVRTDASNVIHYATVVASSNSNPVGRFFLAECPGGGR